MNARGEFGVVGLGRIGGGLAIQALSKGFRVAGTSRKGPSAELTHAGLVDAGIPAGLAAALKRPRVVLLYVPAGSAVDEVLDRLTLDRGDVVVDGGNSYWGDSIRRHRRLADRGLHFVDAGTSGGVKGARSGACFMVGGDAAPVARIEPILRALAVEGGFVHAGGPGAGHFTKLVHNGIEFGMLQAIAEGVELLHRFRSPLKVGEVLDAWRHGSVIRSWLVDLLAQGYRREGGLERIPSFVEDTGEVSWLIADALRMEVPIPVIMQSVAQLMASRNADRLSDRAIALMRHGFGGHPYGPDMAVARERREGKAADSQ
jgi:6-phosphogluconate dehydrogenase